MSGLKELKPEFYLIILYVLLSFTLYYLALYYLKKKFSRNKQGVLSSRLTGVLLFFAVPASFLIINSFNLQDLGINIDNINVSIVWFAGSLPILILINYFNSKKEEHLKHYPEIRTASWDFKLIIISGISWLMYIYAYEFLFRGVFLFITYKYLSFWPTIILNVFLYSVVHIPKGKKESFASIPFGVFVCYISLNTGSFLASFLIHSFLGLFNEWFSIKNNPGMTLKL